MSELSLAGLISVAQAIAIIDSASVTPRLQRVPLAASLNRRLAQPIVADRDDPPFDKSQMDGYAIRAADSSPLRIVGDIPAGAGWTRAVAAGEAMSIMTGAPLPAGADAVIPRFRLRGRHRAVECGRDHGARSDSRRRQCRGVYRASARSTARGAPEHGQ
jgi:molybdopterin biosynthesis enzyme